MKKMSCLLVALMFLFAVHNVFAYGMDCFVPEKFENEGKFVSVPGQVAGSLVCIPMCVPAIPVALVGFACNSMGIMISSLAIPIIPAMTVGTVVSAPFYVAKKVFWDGPGKLIHHIK